MQANTRPFAVHIMCREAPKGTQGNPDSCQYAQNELGSNVNIVKSLIEGTPNLNT